MEVFCTSQHWKPEENGAESFQNPKGEVISVRTYSHFNSQCSGRVDERHF